MIKEDQKNITTQQCSMGRHVAAAKNYTMISSTILNTENEQNVMTQS